MYQTPLSGLEQTASALPSAFILFQRGLHHLPSDEKGSGGDRFMKHFLCTGIRACLDG